MRRIADGVFQLDETVGSNGYLVEMDGHCVVIDPGMKAGLKKLLDEVIAPFPGPVTAILLTHYDVDHAGAAAGLQAATGAPVWLGSPDIPILRRRKKASTPVRRLLNTVGRVAAPRELLPIAGDGEVVPGVRALATPGHTLGYSAFLSRGVLFVGDAAATDVLAGAVPFTNWLHTDPRRAALSLSALRRIAVSHIAPGHGEVVSIGAARESAVSDE